MISLQQSWNMLLTKDLPQHHDQLDCYAVNNPQQQAEHAEQSAATIKRKHLLG